MLEYYEKRQPEYEKIYQKPERQADLNWLEKELTALVEGKRVLEIACGTGYWTRRICKAAASVHATDASSALASAAVASCTTDNVTCGILDAFDLPDCRDFDVVVAGFFLSHVELKKRNKFLDGMAGACKPGTQIVLFDNQYVVGSSTPISNPTSAGDTYQLRPLADGSTHEVLKNFPTDDELHAAMETICNRITVQRGEYFWLAIGQIL